MRDKGGNAVGQEGICGNVASAPKLGAASVLGSGSKMRLGGQSGVLA
jgi:hypothetical protein